MNAHQKKKQLARRKRQRQIGVSIPGFTGAKIIKAPPGQPKMSDVLVDFVAPFASGIETADQYRTLLAIASVAWNAALVGGLKCEEMIQSFTASLSPKNRNQVQQLIDVLFKRKQNHFADINRIIVDFRVTEAPTGFQLKVTSILSST